MLDLLETLVKPCTAGFDTEGFVGRVGCIKSRSSFERSAGDSPVCLLNSSKPMLFRRRSRRSLLPIAYFFRPVVMVSVAMLDIVFVSLLFAP